MKVNWGQLLIMFSFTWFFTSIGKYYGLSDMTLIAYSFLFGAFWPIKIFEMKNKETDDV